MKTYEVHYVERGGFPGAPFDEFEAPTDKAAKLEYEPYFNRSVNRCHCGIRIFKQDLNAPNGHKCIFHKFYHA